MKRETGLTLAEVLVALAVLGIVIAVLTTAMVTSMQQNLVSGERTQAVQILNFLGRLASGGDARVIPENNESNNQNYVAWGYGQLPTAFTELASGDGFMAPERYSAEVVRVGQLRIGATLIDSMFHYRVEVCWQAAGGELCITGDTAGPAVAPSDGGAPALPFVN